jgi:hypothetical protein
MPEQMRPCRKSRLTLYRADEPFNKQVLTHELKPLSFITGWPTCWRGTTSRTELCRHGGALRLKVLTCMLPAI